MESRSIAGPLSGRIRHWKTFIVWIILAVLVVVLLTPLFSYIWRGRTLTHTRQECDLLADALLRQNARDQESALQLVYREEKFLCARNALAAWAYVYGGAGEKEISRILGAADHLPEGIAVLDGDEYHVLSGDFSREEFDAAVQARSSQTEYVTALTPDEEGVGKQSGLLTLYSTVVVDGDICYYSTVFPRSGAIVISKDPVAAIASESREPRISSLMEQRIADSDISMVLVRVKDNVVLQANDVTGIEQGDTLEDLPDQDGKLTIEGVRYVAGTSENGEYRVYALVRSSKISSKTILSPVLVALMFAGLFLLTILYAWFLRTDLLRGRVEYQENYSGAEELYGLLIRHSRRRFFLTSACVLGLLALITTLYVVDDTRVWGSRILSDIEADLFGGDVDSRTIASVREANDTVISDVICSMMNTAPGRFDDGAFADLGQVIHRDLFLLRRDGTVETASKDKYDFSGIADPDSEWAPLRSVLDGTADHLGITVTVDGTSCLCWAVRREDSAGMLICMDDVSDPIILDEYYANYKMPNGLLLLAVGISNGIILSCSEESYSGKNAALLGLTEEALRDGFAGDLLLNGRRYFVQARDADATDDRMSLIAADLQYLAGLYFPVYLKTALAGLLVVILMFALVHAIQKGVWKDMTIPSGNTAGSKGREKEKGAAPDRKEPDGKGKEPDGKVKEKKVLQKEKEEEEKEREETEENATFYRQEGGDLKADRAAVGRWQNIELPFRNQSADDKFRSLMHVLYAVIFIWGFVVYQSKSMEGVMGSTIAYLLQRTWQFGLNIYAISYAVLVIFTINVFAVIVRRLLVFFSKSFGSRGETIARLIGSFIGYASVIGAIVYSLMFFGVNSMAILASAGILGLGISIGAKDLISDILAGVAIVFEGEFRTGDIVEINGFRGTVEEIGVRTTKVMSEGNVKVFRNSEVSGVLNLTQRYSIASVRVSVSRAEPLEKVEKIFKRELPRIRKKIPNAVDDISMGGIAEVNHAYVVLVFSTKCRETDRYLIERTMSREFDLLMERENIGSWGLWNMPGGPLPPQPPAT